MPLRESDAIKIVANVVQTAMATQDPLINESLEDAFMRKIGLVRVIINEPEINLVGGLLKRKDQLNQEVKQTCIETLETVREQLQQLALDRITTKINRLERLLGVEPDAAVVTSRDTFALSGDLVKDNNEIKQELRDRQFTSDEKGALTNEIILLQLLLKRAHNVTVNLPIANMGDFSAILIDLLYSPVRDVEERLTVLQRRYQALSVELIRLRQKRKLLIKGETPADEQPLSLFRTIDFLLHVMRDVQYTCVECQFFSEEQGTCEYALAHKETTGEQSCVEVWNLVANDFWTAKLDPIVDDARKVLLGEE